MRTYYDPTSGADVSSSVRTFLAGARTVDLFDLFWIQLVNPVANTPNVSNFFYTSGPAPIGVAKLQSAPGVVSTVNATFVPTLIRRGTLNYKIGFESDSCELRWMVNDKSNLPSAPWGFKWAAVRGYLDECPIWIHQAVFSAPRVLLGTTLKWRGIIRSVEADRSVLIFKLTSLMDIFQTQIPTQLIQPGNRMAPFAPNGNPASIVGGSLGAPVLGGSTPMDIQFGVTGWTPPPDHGWRDAYLGSYNVPPPLDTTAKSARPNPPMFRIRDNIYDSVGHILHLYPYEPIDPVTMISQGGGYTPIYFPQDSTGMGAPGFPYVPVPEDAA